MPGVLMSVFEKMPGAFIRSFTETMSESRGMTKMPRILMDLNMPNDNGFK